MPVQGVGAVLGNSQRVVENLVLISDGQAPGIEQQAYKFPMIRESETTLIFASPLECRTLRDISTALEPT